MSSSLERADRRTYSGSRSCLEDQRTSAACLTVVRILESPISLRQLA
ncbi:MAG: hypothetical protein V3S94_01500 [Gammaproteobacteria bacterium]